MLVMHKAHEIFEHAWNILLAAFEEGCISNTDLHILQKNRRVREVRNVCSRMLV